MRGENDSSGAPIELGAVYVDNISGFSGVATARAVYLDGDVQAQLTSQGTYRGEIRTTWFHPSRLMRAAEFKEVGE